MHAVVHVASPYYRGDSGEFFLSIISISLKNVHKYYNLDIICFNIC